MERRMARKTERAKGMVMETLCKLCLRELNHSLGIHTHYYQRSSDIRAPNCTYCNLQMKPNLGI
jgi:hypothetical protein